MTDKQREMARHALGLPNKKNESFRNHYCIGVGGDGHADWEALVAEGLAVKRTSDLWGGALPVFTVAELVAAIVESWSGFRAAGWQFAVLMHQAYQAGAEVWRAAVDGCEISDGYAHKCRRAGAFLLAADEAVRARWLAVTLSTAIVVVDQLGSIAPEDAIAIAEAYPRQADAHRAAKRRRMQLDAPASAAVAESVRTDTVLDPADVPPPMRTISATVTLDCATDWRRAVNVIRTHLGQGGASHPTDTGIITAITQTVLQAPELAIRDEFRADVEAGMARCWMPVEGGYRFEVPATGKRLAVCGSYSQLESHHSVPRSLGGHDSERVWLCHDHHASVTNAADGRDWRWLRRALGWDEE